MKKIEWNMSDKDLEMIAARNGNFKYEDVTADLESAKKIAVTRSETTNRAIFIAQTPDGYCVNAHGVAKIGWNYIARYHHGKAV